MIGSRNDRGMCHEADVAAIARGVTFLRHLSVMMLDRNIITLKVFVLAISFMSMDEASKLILI
jgi:hypothetical protein